MQGRELLSRTCFTVIIPELGLLQNTQIYLQYFWTCKTVQAFKRTCHHKMDVNVVRTCKQISFSILDSNSCLSRVAGSVCMSF